MSDKVNKYLLTIASFGLVIYGIYTIINKDNKKDTKATKDNTQIVFDYDKELNLIDNIVLDQNLKFDNETKLRIALSNVDEKDIKITKDTFNDVDYYSFTNNYIEESTIVKYLDDLFGNNNYKLESFYDNNSWYLYDKNDKCFYIFYSNLVTNCMNIEDVDLATNCVEVKPKCDIEYSQDSEDIIVNVSCIEGFREEYKDYDYEYSYKYIYSYDKYNKDYYVSNIKLIEE